MQSFRRIVGRHSGLLVLSVSIRLLKRLIVNHSFNSQCLSRETPMMQYFFPRTWRFVRPRPFIL